MSSAITRNNTADFINAAGDTMTGALLVADGTAAAPSIAFASDADGSGTGIFRVGANALGISIGGNSRFQFNASSDFVPTADNGRNLGAAATRFQHIYLGGMIAVSAMTAPAAPASGAVIYVDTADSDLKIKYADGTVVVIANKP
jgi:hypothetical protein